MNKGIIFTIDGLFALLLIGILIVSFSGYKQTNNLDEIMVSQKIGDLLITSQQLQIKNINTLTRNYKELINKDGYVKINNQIKYIGSRRYKYNSLISQGITYINSFNHKIYIEIGVYNWCFILLELD